MMRVDLACALVVGVVLIGPPLANGRLSESFDNRPYSITIVMQSMLFQGGSKCLINKPLQSNMP